VGVVVLDEDDIYIPWNGFGYWKMKSCPDCFFVYFECDISYLRICELSCGNELYRKVDVTDPAFSKEKMIDWICFLTRKIPICRLEISKESMNESSSRIMLYDYIFVTLPYGGIW